MLLLIIDFVPRAMVCVLLLIYTFVLGAMAAAGPFMLESVMAQIACAQLSRCEGRMSR